MCASVCSARVSLCVCVYICVCAYVYMCVYACAYVVDGVQETNSAHIYTVDIYRVVFPLELRHFKRIILFIVMYVAAV